MKRSRSRNVTAPGADYSIEVIGERRTPLRDFYHATLRMPWWMTIAAISGAFLVVNALFGLGFLFSHGIAHAGRWSFSDAFFFSVQTMGTIGYGAMYPESMAANLLVVAESITSLTLTALATGLVFAKVSRSTARIVFSRQAVISPVGGVATLMFRMGNERGNQIVDPRIRVVMIRTERLPEGGTFYRMLDLPLQRERALSLTRSWSAMHPIKPDSPLHGETPASLREKEIELQILMVGLDDITMQTVHADHRYYAHDIVWGHRPVDVLSETPDGNLVLDLRRFHDIEPTAPTPDFPYP